MARRFALLIGGALLLAALAVSNTQWEQLAGRPAGSLAWGPTLFRLLLAWHGALLLLAARWRPAPGAPHAAALSPRTPAAVWAALIGLSLIALLLRLWRLDSCLWVDEVLTLVDFARLPVGHILTSFPNQNQHMLFSLLAHATLQLFGESAWALRLPSVGFGVASLWALFLLGRRIAGVRAALLACALMAVSYHHIWFSQNARGYMGLLFFATLATWLWLEALERKRAPWWIAYAAACAFGAWIHLTMVFIPAAHALILAAEFLLRRVRAVDFAQAAAAWLLAATLNLQLHALALPEFFRTALHEVSMESEWTNPLWVIIESLRNLRLGFSTAAVLAAGAAFLMAGWWSLARRAPRAAAAMVLPALIGGAFLLSSGHNLWPRFFFFSMGFALLIAIEGALMLPPRALQLVGVAERWRRAAATGAAALLIAASALTIPRCYALPKQDYLGARHYVEQSLATSEAVAAVGLARLVYQKYYAPHWRFPTTAAELQRLQQQYPDLLLVYSLPIQLEAFEPELWRLVQRDFQVIRIFPGTLGGGEVYVCRRRPSPAAAAVLAIE